MSEARGRPAVSVIVPCFNYAHLVEGCVASVLDQPGVDVRVLVIDDCSSDETPAACDRLATADRRVEFRRHRQNKGLVATANEGLEWAEGDYVVLLSADDLLTEGALARATAVMEANPRVGMVYGRPLLAFEGQPPPSTRDRWRRTAVWPGAKWIRQRCRSGENPIFSAEVVTRASVQRAVGDYDATCPHCSDLNMWLRIAAVADVAYIVGAPQAIYRIHADSMWRSLKGPVADLREIWLAFEGFFSACSSHLLGAEELRAMAGRALARQALLRASTVLDRGVMDRRGMVTAAELSEFALAVYPDARRLRQWRGLQTRRRFAGHPAWFLPAVAAGAAHKVRARRGQLTHALDAAFTVSAGTPRNSGSRAQSAPPGDRLVAA